MNIATVASSLSTQSAIPTHKPYVPPHLRNRLKDSGAVKNNNSSGAASVGGGSSNNNNSLSSPPSGYNKNYHNDGFSGGGGRSELNGVGGRGDGRDGGGGYLKSNARQYHDNSYLHRDFDDDRDRRGGRYDRDRRDERDRRNDRERRGGDDRFERRGGDDRFERRGGDDKFERRGGDDRFERRGGDDRFERRGGDDRFERKGGDDKFERRGGDDRFERKGGDDKFERRGGDDKFERRGGDDRFERRGGDDRFERRGGDDKFERRGGDDKFERRGGDDRFERKGGDDKFERKGGDDKFERKGGDDKFERKGGDDKFERKDDREKREDNNRKDERSNGGRLSSKWRLEDEFEEKRDSKAPNNSGGVVIANGRTNITISNNTTHSSMNPNLTGWENRDGRRYYKEQEEDVFSSIAKFTGVSFDSYDSIPVEMSGRGADAIAPIESFQSTQGVHPLLMNNVKRVKYERPTPVQKHSIPAILARRDLMACAQTGSGKTAAFLFPILTNMLLDSPPRLPHSAKQFMMKQPSYPVCLVLSPTRELAVQIYEEARKFQYGTGIRTVALYGGSDVHTQLRDLDKGCDVCVATPGRLTDLIDRKKVRLVLVKYLVLDEADRMLDMGFSPQITAIIEDNDMPSSKDGRQTVMFSATFPKEIQHMARDFLDDYLYLAVGRVGSTNEFICQRLMYADEDQKPKYLTKLLREQDKGLTIIFVETKKKADLIEDFLISDDFPAVSIHGDRSQMEREKALKLFKSGERPILVATDVAARGLDIQNIMHVINCDLPTNIDDYVHRIGRTGRAGNLGVATSFVNEENRQILRKLLELLHESNQEIPGWFQSLVMSTSSASNCRGGGNNDFSTRGTNNRYGGTFGSRDMRAGGESYAFSHGGRSGAGVTANGAGRLGGNSKTYTGSDAFGAAARKAVDVPQMGFPKDDAW